MSHWRQSRVVDEFLLGGLFPTFRLGGNYDHLVRNTSCTARQRGAGDIQTVGANPCRYRVSTRVEIFQRWLASRTASFQHQNVNRRFGPGRTEDRLNDRPKLT